MTLEPRDLTKLRWHLLGALLLIGIGTGIAWMAHRERLQADTLHQTAVARYQAVGAKLRQVNTEEQEIKDKAAFYKKLSASGLLGEEKRLDWTELLRAIQQQLHLPKADYEFSPQVPVAGGQAEQYIFVASPMRLSLQLVHEGDLLTYLGLLQKHAKALVIVRSCAVSRLPPNQGTATGNLAQLNAQCEIDWITARRQNGGAS